MNKTVNLNDNYGKRLRDEIIDGNSETGLKGEVEIQVKNTETGEIESQQKHNLIVYGGREWLLKKAFNSNVAENSSFIKNSEILWFGVGNGGGEPGNPLQCGCTYGSDNDLYNPIRLRYEFNTSSQSVNPYYASRIMPNGEVVNGYYKKITYVNVKEDQANPYKKNNTVMYPNLIAEVRLEISSDDCCGQTYLNNDYEKSYADVNEAALFIADNRLVDPGQNDKLTYQSYDYTTYNEKRLDLPDLQKLPDYNVVSGNYVWTNDKPFPNNCVQYYNVYKKVVGTVEDHDYVDNGIYYKLEGNMINTQPIVLGIYKTDTSTCTGSISYTNNKINIQFTNGSVTNSQVLDTTDFSVTGLNDVLILTNGSIAIDITRTTKIDGPIKCQCKYRNSYTTDFVDITLLKDVFGDDLPTYESESESESESETSKKYRYIVPVGYVQDIDGVWKKDNSFTKKSIIRVVQTSDLSTNILIEEIETDTNSLECKFYVDHSTIKKLSEGMKIYTYNDSMSLNVIPESNPATINEIYDAEADTEISGTTKRSYFTIERAGLQSEVYKGSPLYVEGGLNARTYALRKDSPYIMFNRVTFSTIRVSKNRLVNLIWRIYF